MDRSERLAFINANIAARDEIEFDLEERRQHRLLNGEPAKWTTPAAPRKIIRKIVTETPTPPQAGLSDSEIDTIVWFITERLAEATAPLIERIKTLEDVAEQRSAAWLDKMRRKQ